MTNFDHIKAKDDMDLAFFLCNLFDAEDCNTKCPAAGYCYSGHNGMIDWLRAERKDNETD